MHPDVRAGLDKEMKSTLAVPIWSWHLAIADRAKQADSAGCTWSQECRTCFDGRTDGLHGFLLAVCNNNNNNTHAEDHKTDCKLSNEC